MSSAPIASPITTSEAGPFCRLGPSGDVTDIDILVSICINLEALQNMSCPQNVDFFMGSL